MKPPARGAVVALVMLLAACAGQTVPPNSTPTLSPTRSPSATPLSTVSPAPTATPTQQTEPTPTATPSGGSEDGLTVARTIPYATTGDCGERVTECQQFVDVYAPSAGGPWPVAVMLHGRPRRPSDMEELARAVAGRGAVVFNADYRGVRPVQQKGWPEAIEDVACAVRFARAHAAEWGGDPSRLVLVGHSFGGYVGTLVALAGDEFSGECLVEEGSALPTAWVGISANCLVGVPPPVHPLWLTFYGGSAEERPAVWDKGDPLNHLDGNPTVVVRMVHQRDDEVVDIVQPRTLVRELKDAGYDASMTVLDGGEHWGPLDMDSVAGQATLAVVAEVLGLP